MSRGQQQRRRAGRGDDPPCSWSAAWSAHLDGLGDFAGRRERGREYVVEGAVRELHLEPGRISACVQGSRVYRPRIVVLPVPEAVRAGLREVACADGCSPRDLLRAALATPKCGVLPQLRELSTVCTCPDRARPCKHILAALYAVGPRLDEEPELLFMLRGVDPGELVRGPERPRRPRPRPTTTRAPPRPVPRIVAQRRAAAKTVRVARRKVWRAELRALGIPASTIDGWLGQGLLRRTAERGVYRRTAALDRRLARRGIVGP